jgi:arginyl-tRNA--protein-N-Asp/Glu arginylyltransferase
VDSETTLLSAPETCPYLPERVTQMRYQIAVDLTPATYMSRLDAGWRRFGPIMFRHECPACRRCQSLRIPVARFQPSAGQRRVWRKNVDVVDVRIGTPSTTREKLDLFRRFHRHGHEHKGWPADAGHDLSLFTINPFRTEEWTFFVDHRLAAVGYVDALSEGLSAIYFFHDPQDARRSLGTFNILSMIDRARQRGLRYVYLGYYVSGCRSLEYKARFRPNEVLNDHAEWIPSATSGT